MAPVDRHLEELRGDGHARRLIGGGERVAGRHAGTHAVVGDDLDPDVVAAGEAADSAMVTSVPVTSTAAGIHVSPSALHSTVNVISSNAPGSGSSTSQCTVCVRADPIVSTWTAPTDGAVGLIGWLSTIDPVDEQVERYGSFDPRDRREESERPRGV